MNKKRKAVLVMTAFFSVGAARPGRWHQGHGSRA